MNTKADSSNLMSLLNEALLRELRVSIQYMLQHSIENGKRSVTNTKKQFTRQSNFIASHSSMWLPGSSLKKIAISEMRHAESIAERIVVLGGEPTNNPGTVTIGATTTEMLEIDREEEQGAIDLYGRIIEVAEQEDDIITISMFQRILSDEKNHYDQFTKLLE
jgi:bacterioferritin